MQKLLTTITLLILLSIIPTSFSYAQDDVKTELNAIENERTQRIEEMLLLNLPEISDNPNHIVTFKDPSGEGVFLEIDGQDFEKITSPYTLPSLSLGRHILTFKFTDKEKTEQTFEKIITIIPRPAVLNPPSVVDNEIKISGTAMANSEVEIFLSRDISNQKALAEVNEEGEWEHTFTEDIEKGIYTVIATTRRNGYSSYYSEPIVFEIGEDSHTVTSLQENEGGISFNLANLNPINYKDTLQILKNSPDLLIAFGILFLLGSIFAWFLIAIVTRISQKKSKKALKELLRQKNTQEPSSFKDKFEKSKEIPQQEEENEKEQDHEKKEEVEEKEDSKKKEEKDEDEDEEAKTLTKKEFLKKFKYFDPDDDKGNEKELKKKNIKISLTSKD